MAKTQRSGRVNEEVRREVAEIVKNELKDPRVDALLCSILRAEVTADLAYAKIFVTMYGDVKQQEEALAALVQAKGFIRKQLSQRLTTRRVPTLIFVADDSIEYAIKMSKRIDEVIRGDNDE